MLSEPRAERMARRAARRRRDGGRGPVARRAWRRLVEAGDRRDENAVSAVWRAWLAEPDDELWAELARWRGGRFLADQASAVAVQPERAPGERAAIGAFCVRHGLVPEDAIERALFFALTGQAGQERAADPDGSLLAAAYRAAEPETRAALREAMAGAGHLDLARVVGAADRATPITAEESEYLVHQLDGRRDWPALWRLVQDLPPASAVMATRRFDHGWRPASDAGRAFFDELAGVSLDMVTRAREVLARPGLIRLETPGWAWAGSFSPDGRRMVVMVHPGRAFQGRGDCEARVFELPSGCLAERYEARFDGLGPVVHLGDAFIANTSAGPVRALRRYSRPLRQPVGDIVALAPYGSGFAALRHERAGDMRRVRVLVCDHSGRVLRSRRVDNGLGTDHPSWLAVEPGSGRLAVGSDRDFKVLEPPALHFLASPFRSTGATSACFLGPDRLVTLHDSFGRRALETWRVEPGNLVRLNYQERASLPHDSPVHEVVPVPEHAEVMIRDGGTVRYLHGESLAEATERRPLSGRNGVALWHLAGGATYALGRAGFVEVTDTRPAAVLALVDRPQAELRPSDLAAVNDAALLFGDSREVRSLESLLRACLEHRFAAEIALGEIPAAGPEDIALSMGGDPPC